MICYCNKTKIHCLQWFHTVSLKIKYNNSQDSQSRKKSIVKIYSKKPNKRKSLFEKVNQHTTELLLIFTTNKYLHQNKIK